MEFLILLIISMSLAGGWALASRGQKAKKLKPEPKICPPGHQMIKHHCGGRNYVPDRFIVGQSFLCTNCKKEIRPTEVRCLRCKALIRLKTYTPFFFHTIQCPCCKIKFELPTQGSKIVG